MTDSMLNRIKEKAQQARGLLSPWLRKSDSQGDDAGGHLMITDRHRLAARKMRVLDDQKLGGAHPQTVLSLNAGLSERMQSIQNMLHFNANISRDTSIWPKVDQVFPSQAAEAPREPEQPGIMKAGTIIQKFSMTPKPGQSIQSFKEQMARQNQAPAPASRPKAPVLPAKARLFSRVQEITHREKSLDNEIEDSSATSQLPAISSALPQKAFDLPQPSLDTASESVSSPQPEALKPAPEEKKTEPVSEKGPVPANQDKPAVPSSDTPSISEQKDTEKASKIESSPENDMPVRFPPEVIPSQTLPLDLSQTADKGQADLKQARPVVEQPEAIKPTSPRIAAARPAKTEHKKAAPPAARPAQTVQRQLDNQPRKSAPDPAQPSGREHPLTALPFAGKRTHDLPPRQPGAVIPSTEKAARNEPETDLPTPGPVLRHIGKPIEDTLPFASAGDDTAPPASTAREQKSTPLPAFTQPPASSLDVPAIDASPVSRTEEAAARPAPTGAPIPEALGFSSSAQPSMPLHTRLVARKEAFQPVKTAGPELLRAVQAKPLVQPRAGRIPERKSSDRSPARSSTPTDSPTAPSVSAPSASPVVQRAMEAVQSSQPSAPAAAPLNLLLAAAQPSHAAPARQAPPVPASMTPATVSQTAQSKVEKDVQTNKSETAPGSLSQQKAARPQISPLKTPGAGVVQRRWEEHSGPDSVAHSSSERQEETQQLPVDLDQVASDVLPLVKRLLDIELERLSGGFH